MVAAALHLVVFMTRLRGCQSIHLHQMLELIVCLQMDGLGYTYTMNMLSLCEFNYFLTLFLRPRRKVGRDHAKDPSFELSRYECRRRREGVVVRTN